MRLIFTSLFIKPENDSDRRDWLGQLEQKISGLTGFYLFKNVFISGKLFWPAESLTTAKPICV